MENTSSTIRVQVDSHDMKITNNILKNLGLNMSTYVNMAIKQLISKEKIPFEVKNTRPNKQLLEAFQEGEDILNGKIQSKKYHNVKELIEDLENDI